jgi:YD repeat-containing protein
MPAARSSALPVGIATITDPLSRVTSFGYDAANRLIRQTLPDGRVVRFEYDDGDNLTSVIPPSRPAYAFTYTGVDLLGTDTPPAVSNGGTTKYRYNRDRQPIEVLRPDTANSRLQL